MKETNPSIFKHPLVQGALAVVAVIAVGSGIYYYVSTRQPAGSATSPVMGSIEEVVTGTGTVTPAQNPDLAFLSGGRVTRVNVAVGDTVYAGETLASLDTATLSAQRANAEANLESQQANLAQMQAGPRTTDLQPKQTAVDQANQTLQNSYANVPADITQAYDESLSGISSDTDTLFSQPDTPSPTLVFNTTDNQAGVDAVNGRVEANNTLTTWNTSIAALGSASTPQQLDAALATAISNLQIVQTYNNSVLLALNTAIPSTNFPQASVTAAQTSVGGLRDTINGLISTLQGLEQQLASDQLAVQSAQDALNQVLAGSTPQAIQAQQAQVDAAQANVALYDAQISNDIIVAPFSGTVSSVSIDPGDIVDANTPAISLNPEGALEVYVYLSEVDAAKVAVGNPAQVTLDAYGTAQPFQAAVVSVDKSPTTENGESGYKVTLQFANPDPRITPGAAANVTIVTAQKNNALIIPASAVIQNGAEDFVLVQSGGTTQERQVQLGIQSTSTDEVTSGLSSQDLLLVNGQ